MDVLHIPEGGKRNRKDSGEHHGPGSCRTDADSFEDLLWLQSVNGHACSTKETEECSVPGEQQIVKGALGDHHTHPKQSNETQKNDPCRDFFMLENVHDEHDPEGASCGQYRRRRGIGFLDTEKVGNLAKHNHNAENHGIP